MVSNPRHGVAAESYPTFWDEIPPAPAASTVTSEDAYAAFVNLIEDDGQPLNCVDDE